MNEINDLKLVVNLALKEITEACREFNEQQNFSRVHGPNEIEIEHYYDPLNEKKPSKLRFKIFCTCKEERKCE